MSHAASMLRTVDLSEHVRHLGVIRKRLITVRKAFRNVVHKHVFFRELKSLPLHVGRRVLTQVHNHVIDCAFNAAYELCFGIGSYLEMHASNGALRFVEGAACLSNLGIQTVRFEVWNCERCREVTAVIFNFFNLYREGVF